MVIALLIDDYGLVVVAPVDNTMTHMYDIRPVNAGFVLEVIEEMRKGTGMIFHTRSFFLLDFAP